MGWGAWNRKSPVTWFMCHDDQSGSCLENRQEEGEGRDRGTNAEVSEVAPSL